MKLLIDWTLYQSDLDQIAKEKKVIVFNFLSIRLLNTRSTEESDFAGQIEKTLPNTYFESLLSIALLNWNNWYMQGPCMIRKFDPIQYSLLSLDNENICIADKPFTQVLIQIIWSYLPPSPDDENESIG